MGHRVDGFAPIGDYAVVSDGRTTALIAADGAVDWWSAPTVDAPPLAAAILDPQLGGTVTLAPEGEYRTSRRYLPGSSVLETTYQTGTGSVRVVDSLNAGVNGPLPWTELARRVEGVEGEVPMRWTIALGRRFSAAEPWAQPMEDYLLVHTDRQDVAVVADNLGSAVIDGTVVSAAFTLRPGEQGLLALTAVDRLPLQIPRASAVSDRLDETMRYHRRWRQRIHYDGPAEDAVLRSAAVLRQLTSQNTGAQAAAATTSLPEKIGGRRNYDYRFAWVRDASFAVDALADLALVEEVHAVLTWLLRALENTAPEVHVFYTLDGRPAPDRMEEVPFLRGYRDSRPVHVGNSAAHQLQLGVYGDLIDAVHRAAEIGYRLDARTAQLLSMVADRACDLWRLPDAGIWELDENRHYTISKIGCWVALDRMVGLAEDGQVASLSLSRWRIERQRIRDWIEEHCWSRTKQSLTFYAGTDDLDAAVLLAARTGFWDGDDPRLATTVDAVREELGAGGPLLYRYTGQRDQEGAFVACSFWLVEALAHIGRVKEAEEVLDGMLEYCNDLGLLSEEVDPGTGELLGNFPQALSHLSLIGAASALHEARRPG
jgi:GH15 family glucan-1,4-alpha-glucosidase